LPQISCDFAELFQGSFQVFDNFLGEKVGIGKIVGFLQGFRLRARCKDLPLLESESKPHEKSGLSVAVWM
jgi:hypothetical protein